MNSALIKWLYLPDFFSAPNATNLISESPAPHAHTPLPAMLRLCRCPGWAAGGHQPFSPASKGPIAQASPGSPVLPFPVGSVSHECTPSHRHISRVHILPHRHMSAHWCGHRCACRYGHRRTRVWRLMPHGIRSGSRWPHFLTRVVCVCRSTCTHRKCMQSCSPTLTCTSTRCVDAGINMHGSSPQLPTHPVTPG